MLNKTKKGNRIGILQSKKEMGIGNLQSKKEMGIGNLQSKKGQAQIIVTVLIILLVLSLVVILWNVVRGVVDKGVAELEVTSQISDMTVESLEIENQNAIVRIKKGPSEGIVNKIKIVLRNDAGQSQVQTLVAELGPLGIKTFTFVNSIANPTSVEVYPIFEIDGVEKIGPISDILKGDSRHFSDDGSFDSSAVPESGGEEPPVECAEDWSCTDWTECLVDTQTRICSDVNSCETELEKPEETQSCVPEEPIDSLTQGLIGYWSFDDGTVTDNSGNGNDGSVIGGVNFINGASGRAVNFDGIDGYVSIPNTDILNNLDGDSSISFWVNIPVDQNGMELFSKGIPPAPPYTYPFAVRIISGPKLIYRIYDGDAGPTIVTNSLSLNEWIHVVGIRDTGSDESRIYINGVLSKSAIDSTTQSVSNLLDVNFGRRTDTGLYFNGDMDEVRIYDKVLSQEEITALSSV